MFIARVLGQQVRGASDTDDGISVSSVLFDMNVISSTVIFSWNTPLALNIESAV